MTDIKKLLYELTSAPGVSGEESLTAQTAEKLIAPFCDEIKRGALGSSIAVLSPGKEKSVMLVAHTDKIGLIVTGIDKDTGMLKTAKVGGTDLRTLAASRVKVYGKKTLDGVVISVPPHLAGKGDEKRAVPVEETAVDCGLPYDEIKDIVSPGDRIEIRLPFRSLAGDRVTSPYIDDAAGCAALISAAERLYGKELPCTVYAVFSTREEVGKQGAQTAAFTLSPDEAIAVDVGFAVQKGVSEEQGANAGSGARIGFAPVLDRKLSAKLRETAEKNGIPFTVEVMGRTTGTDADVVSAVKCGVAAGVVSIPLKYMHTPVETVSISDIEAAAKLLAAYILGKGE